MLLNANAKINLSLDVGKKREDGYHTVTMIMQEISLHDTVFVEQNDTGNIQLSCDSDLIPTNEKNIAWKAAKLFLETASLPLGCSIHIEKRIPVCAGLAGGSTDAAAVLKGLNSLNHNRFTVKELSDLGKKLGADVPFCIQGGTCLAEGIGEILTPIKMKKKLYVLLIKPLLDISTPVAYKALDSIKYQHPDVYKTVQLLEKESMTEFYAIAKNVFEAAVCPKHNCIEEIKTDLLSQGAAFSMMSGSGPTVFGLFEEESTVNVAFKTLKTKYSNAHLCEFVY